MKVLLLIALIFGVTHIKSSSTSIKPTQAAPTPASKVPSASPTKVPSTVPTKAPSAYPTNAPTFKPTKDPTDSSDSSSYSYSVRRWFRFRQSDDGSNDVSQSGSKKRRRRKRRRKKGGSNSVSESSDEALFAAAAHNDIDDNNENAEDGGHGHGEYILSLGFGTFSLLNIWLLFGVSVAINIMLCFLCHKKTEMKPVRDDSTIDF